MWRALTSKVETAGVLCSLLQCVFELQCVVAFFFVAVRLNAARAYVKDRKYNSVLQCVAVCCSVLQCVAVCVIAARAYVKGRIVCCSVLQRVETATVVCSVLQCFFYLQCV